jgi:hypothetical protein
MVAEDSGSAYLAKANNTHAVREYLAGTPGKAF